MLVDDVRIQVTAGHGGKGAVAFNKNMKALGPVGGSGGRGGSVYLEGTADIGALRHFRFTKRIEAEHGHDGRGQFVDGRDGKDAVVTVPVGTVITNLDTDAVHELVKIGERVCVAEGGKGGKGNFHFRSSTNTTPKQSQPGLPGEAFALRLELKLIADVGLVGLPNVGKSSFLNAVTRAGAKVANYAFTTLEPNLGAYDTLILADIPGLIEGASEGKGLGAKFLRHIERTRILFHFVAADSSDPARDYRTVRTELATHHADLIEKPEYVFLSRTDNVSDEETAKKVAMLKKLNHNTHPLSLLDDKSVEAARNILNHLASEK